MVALDQLCPECGGVLLYDAASKRLSCKKCGLFLTRDELTEIRVRQKNAADDGDMRKKHRQQADYLDWWLKDKKEKQ